MSYLCRSTGKRVYPTERRARVELVGAVVAFNGGRRHRREQRVYQCPSCKGWHLTSKPKIGE